MSDQNGSTVSACLDTATAFREFLSDKQQTIDAIRYRVTRDAQESGGDLEIREVFARIYTRQAESNLEVVHRECESPIELTFFSSFLMSCAANGVMVVVRRPPPGDFREYLADRHQWIEKLFKCWSFYHSLPGDGRPGTFLQFLEKTAVARGGIPQEEAEFTAIEASAMFEIPLAHAIHLTLQPTFQNFSNGKVARPDAVIWIPSRKGVRIVLECDGFETHGKKQAFCRDRSRDRIFQGMGYSVRRYAGQEIYHDPAASGKDLAFFLIDEGLTTSTNSRWERNLKRHRSAKAGEEQIRHWRQRIADEKGAGL